MTIAERCAPASNPKSGPAVSSSTSSARVTLTDTADTRLTATVQPRTGAPYHVELAFDLVLSDIEATCTCQDYGRGTLCHHIWATILAAG